MLLKYSIFKYNKVCILAFENIYNLYSKNLWEEKGNMCKDFEIYCKILQYFKLTYMWTKSVDNVDNFEKNKWISFKGEKNDYKQRDKNCKIYKKTK